MASKDQVESLTEEIICPICLDFFTDPVSLECGHNFCRSCITQSWDREGRNSCPECREQFADRTLRVSRALARLAEKARTLSTEHRTEKESKLHCEEHQEELKLFCETDKKLICVVCAAGREHKSHSFMPVKEAVENHKGQVKSSIQSLTKDKSGIQQMEQQQKEKISGVLEQSHNLQSKITSQFAELHQILTEKEQHVRANIREEEKRILNVMEKNLQEIEENLNSIQEELFKLQQQMDQKDSVMFLKEEAGRNRRVGDEAKPQSVVDDNLLIEKFETPFLYNMVLAETSDAIKQVSVTLDVETAHPELEVSEDRKRVRWTGTRRSLPDTGKRFTGWECVLGSEGFTSGRHYWEVEVAGSRGWSLGVAADSVERKEWARFTPETGVWSIRWGGDGFVAFTSPRSRLPARPIPGRVGVYLSYESGTVSFYDADTKSHLHTFTGNKFTEKLYPFFETWDENHWLRVCERVGSRDRRQERGSGAAVQKPGGQQVHLSHFFKMAVMMETLRSSGRRPSSQTKADIDGEIHQLLLRACTKFGRLRRRVFDERISKVPQISTKADIDGEIHQLLLRACTTFGRLRRRVFDERISKAPQISVNAALGMRNTG
ncbi:E3 ubiquitin-protein ligase TRIM11-like [Rhinoraja longicauda]